MNNNIQYEIINEFKNKIISENLINLILNNNDIIDINFDSFDNYSQMFFVISYISNHSINLINIDNDNEELICFKNELDEIKNNYQDDLKGTVKILKKQDGILCYRINNIYFFYNLNEKPCKIILPKSLQNINAFCIFCNNDKYLKDSFILRPLHFDLLEK